MGHCRCAIVTASDKHPRAAAFLVHNLWLNALPPTKYRHGEWAPAAPPLPDGSAPRSALARGAASASSAVHSRYELLIASDVLYERESGGILDGFIGRHAAPVAEIWIVDSDRGNRPPFNRAMKALGCALTDERLGAIARPGSAAFKGRLPSYRRSG